MKLKCSCAILVSVLAIQAGYGANENEIPTFDEVIGDANIVIRPIQKELSVKIGNNTYLIDAQGNLKAPNDDKNDVQIILKSEDQIDLKKEDQFDVSILGGLINLRCKAKNDNDASDPLWNIILFNTKYDETLAIQADYVHTLNVAAKELVTNARKNWIQNYGYLVSDHLTELSKRIVLYCQHEGNYSTNHNVPGGEFETEGNLALIWNQCRYEEFDEQGNLKNLGFYCDADAKISTNGHVKIVGLESEVFGQVNVNRWISDKKVHFDINPRLKNDNQAQIQINYLNAPNVTVNVPVEQVEQSKYLGKNDNGSVYFVVNQSVNPILFEDDIKENIKNEIEEEEEDFEEKKIDLDYIKENIDSVYLDEDSTLAILPVVLKSAIFNIIGKVHSDIVDPVLGEWRQEFDNLELVIKDKSYKNMNVVLQKLPTSDGTTENNGLFKCTLFNHQGQICDEELMRQIWNNSIQKLNADKKAEVFKSIQDEVSKGDLDKCYTLLLIRQADTSFAIVNDMLHLPHMIKMIDTSDKQKPGYKQSIGNLLNDDGTKPMSATETFLLDLIEKHFKSDSNDNREKKGPEE